MTRVCDGNPFQPHKIVSLWEVLDFYAHKYVDISGRLGQLVLLLDCKMKSGFLRQTIPANCAKDYIGFMRI